MLICAEVSTAIMISGCSGLRHNLVAMPLNSVDPYDPGTHTIRGRIRDIAPLGEPGEYAISIDVYNDGNVDYIWRFSDVDYDELIILQQSMGQGFLVDIQYTVNGARRTLDSVERVWN